MATLTDYLTDTRRLLRDETGSVYTDGDLTAFINRAIQQRDLELGLNRVRISFPMTTGQVAYPISTILSGGTVLTGPSSPNVIDVLSITVIPIGPSPGGIRYPLARWPYSKITSIPLNQLSKLSHSIRGLWTGNHYCGPATGSQLRDGMGFLWICKSVNGRVILRSPTLSLDRPDPVPGCAFCEGPEPAVR